MSSSEIEAASLSENTIECLTQGLIDANSELEPGLPSSIPQVVRDGLTISAPPSSQDDAQGRQAVPTPTNLSTEPSHHTPTGSIPQASLGALAKPLAWLVEPSPRSVVPLETVNWPALSGNPMGGKRHRKEVEGITRGNEVDQSLLNPTYQTDKTHFPCSA
ncbi:hypothetical protein Bca4012_064140 [Brassica carinata]|uniref:Uncharacterized protein n=1 Tax=Brassica carinata TaxID=52824 RepID=A0A8X7SEW3_BRACI|nr:hypothetical protein Bca52824_033713 [Brassica carinata]